MGCGSSQQSEVNNPGNKQPQQNNDFQVNFQAFISEKTGSYENDYKLGKVLGTGAFGVVRIVVHKATNEIRAMKILSKKGMSTEEQKQNMVTDISILRKLDHPSIMRIYEFYQDANDFYIITELYNGGELFDKIIDVGSFTENEAAKIMKTLIGVIAYAHSQNVVHRDLKPENLLLDTTSDGSYQIKVIDWGGAAVFQPGKFMSTLIGTPYYIAPEVLKKKYNEKCDVWSCGVILYILLTGEPPFGGNSDQEIMDKVKIGQWEFSSPQWKQVSDEAKDFITQMMTYDPVKRISAAQALEHPWLKNQNSTTQVNQADVINGIKTIKKFTAKNNFSKAVLQFIGYQMLSKEEKDKILKVFQGLDKNGDGTLTQQEIIDGYKQFYNPPEDAEKEARRIFETLDSNKSGAVDYKEFIIASMDQSKITTEKNLQQAFNYFDLDHSGDISKKELKQILGNDPQFEELWKLGDANSDGKITLQEFIDLMKKL